MSRKPRDFTNGNDKNYYQPAIIGGYNYGGAYGQGTSNQNISYEKIKDIDNNRTDNAIRRGWCQCLQCGALLGALALARAGR